VAADLMGVPGCPVLVDVCTAWSGWQRGRSPAAREDHPGV